jgi:hypothetical protein
VSTADVAAFVVMPVLLAATLVWASLVAWRRSGASESAARLAAIVVSVDSAAWMALTCVAAMSGILQQWDCRPPPFALIPVGVLMVSMDLQSSCGPNALRACRSQPASDSDSPGRDNGAASGNS